MKTLYLSLACCIALMSIIGLQAGEFYTAETTPNRDYVEVSFLTYMFNPNNGRLQLASNVQPTRGITVDTNNGINEYEVHYPSAEGTQSLTIALDAERLGNTFGLWSNIKQYFGVHGGSKNINHEGYACLSTSINRYEYPCLKTSMERSAKMSYGKYYHYDPKTGYVYGKERATIDVSRGSNSHQPDTIKIKTYLHKNAIKERCRRAKIFTGVVAAGAVVAGGIAYFGLPKQSGTKNPKAS